MLFFFQSKLVKYYIDFCILYLCIQSKAINMSISRQNNKCQCEMKCFSFFYIVKWSFWWINIWQMYWVNWTLAHFVWFSVWSKRKSIYFTVDRVIRRKSFFGNLHKLNIKFEYLSHIRRRICFFSSLNKKKNIIQLVECNASWFS